jgi:hypothetical protein
MFAPFFSIFASARMTRGKQKGKDHVPVSLSMFFLPFVFTLMILIPDRNLYLLNVVIIFFLYLLAPLFDRLYDLVKRPFRFLKGKLSTRINLDAGTLSVSDRSHESIESRKLKILNHLTVISSTLIGAVMFSYGVYVCYSHLTSPVFLILQYFMVAGVLLFVGIQMLSIGLTGLSSPVKKQPYLTDQFQLLFATISAVVLIFGGFTYSLSWNIDIFFERQLLVISSTLMVIWAISLLVKLKEYLRLLSGIILLIGASLATWIWISLSDTVMYLVGYTCIAGLVLYLLLVLREILGRPKIVEAEENSDIEEIKVAAE